MRLVAFLAVSGDHISRVRFVALRALRNLAVDIMAHRAGNGRVLALVLFELLVLLRMAGKAGIRHVVRKRDLERGVRISVAAETSLQFEVRLSPVAVAALRDRFLYRWRMAVMAARTPDILVLPSGGCYVSRGCSMTFHTVIISQTGC